MATMSGLPDTSPRLPLRLKAASSSVRTVQPCSRSWSARSSAISLCVRVYEAKNSARHVSGSMQGTTLLAQLSQLSFAVLRYV
jgi:hypothetical protein